MSPDDRAPWPTPRLDMLCREAKRRTVGLPLVVLLVDGELRIGCWHEVKRLEVANG